MPAAGEAEEADCLFSRELTVLVGNVTFWCDECMKEPSVGAVGAVGQRRRAHRSPWDGVSVHNYMVIRLFILCDAFSTSRRVAPWGIGHTRGTSSKGFCQIQRENERSG